MAAAQSRQEMPLIGRFWTWWAGHLVQRQAQQQQQRQQDQLTYDAGVRAYRHSEREQQKELHSPEFRALEHQVQFTGQAHAQAARAASEAARQLDAAVAGLAGRRPSLEPLKPATLQCYLAWLRDTIPLLERRHEILQEWRTRLGSRTEELYPVIIRMADVVGATCIGIATDDAFEHLDFDLAIADEAGQISLPDLLVPLVRARRALLVGDHHQLPPFVENEVQAWLKQVRPEVLVDLNWLDTEDHATNAILDLLTKSVFEMLFPVADPSRVVRFTQQYRMPEAVADFAGRCFYEGQFYTGCS